MRIGGMVKQKRGVSPLIATVLLISFAVALGAVVLNWGRGIEIDSTDPCSGVHFQLRSIADGQVCFVQGEDEKLFLNFIVDNDGRNRIQGMGVWVSGSKGTDFLNVDGLGVGPGELLNVEGNAVAYNFGLYGTIANIQFVPKVSADEICPLNSVKTQNIVAC